MSTWPDAFPVLLAGLATTLKLAGITGALAVLLSALLAILSTSPHRAVRLAVGAYVDFFRSIPILVALIFVYYGVGRVVTNLGLSGFWVAVIVLTAIESAYLSEIYRGALNAIAPQQWHAASSLGLGWSGTVGLVILPQALPPALPSTVNMLIAIMKDSALASLISVPEATLSATSVISITFEPMPIYALLALMYLAVILPLSGASKYLEGVVDRRFGAHVHAISTDLATSQLMVTTPGDGRR